MFNRFTSLFHHAVDALSVDQPLHQQFTLHWKSVTQYFIDVKDHKVGVDQTPLPVHLGLMLDALVEEEEGGESGLAGLCMEYLLQHRILETLYALARTDCPPGMKQVVLQLFTRLLTRIRQPLLPHVHVHRPVQRLVRMCGEVRAGPAESDEVQFLVALCSLIKSDPSLVNFFIEMSRVNSKTLRSEKEEEEYSERVMSEKSAESQAARFTLIDSLLILMLSEDARVSVKACEGLMLIASLRDGDCAWHIVHNTRLVSLVVLQLSQLYDNLPRVMHPAHIASVEAKWGLDMLSSNEDRTNFPGKRNLISFLSWLDFCDQLSATAHDEVGLALSRDVKLKLLNKSLCAWLLLESESECITATAYLTQCIRLLSSKHLVSVFAEFILGEAGQQQQVVKEILISRLNSVSNELCLTTWQLFDALLMKQDTSIIFNLVLRNLIHSENTTNTELSGCSGVVYSCYEDVRVEDESTKTLSCEKTVVQSCNNSDIVTLLDNEPHNNTSVHCRVTDRSNRTISIEKSVMSKVLMNGEIGENCDHSDTSLVCSDHDEAVVSDGDWVMTSNGDGFLTKSSSDRDGEGGGGNGDDVIGAGDGDGDGDLMELLSSLEVNDDDADADDDDELLVELGLERERTDEVMSEGTSEQVRNTERDESSSKAETSVQSFVHHTINAFLSIVPEEAKSRNISLDCEYETYLRDAHHQYRDVWRWCGEEELKEGGVVIQGQEDEGPFIKALLDKLCGMLQQSYELNLELTSIVSRIALFSHSSIDEFFLSPCSHTAERRTLTSVLHKIADDVRSHMSSVKDFQSRLFSVRHKLSGNNSRTRSTSDEDEQMFLGVIVLEEFCKELAAIAFVKHHSSCHSECVSSVIKTVKSEDQLKQDSEENLQ